MPDDLIFTDPSHAAAASEVALSEAAQNELAALESVLEPPTHAAEPSTEFPILT